jgi:hypothetical protein
VGSIATSGSISALAPSSRRALSSPQLAADQARQPPRALVVAAAGLDDRGGHRGGQKRSGGTGVAQLLQQHGQLDGAQALAPVGLGHRDPGPSQIHDLAPQRVVVRRGLSRLADLGEGGAGGEQLAGDVLDLPLVLGQVEIHVVS